MPSGNQVHCRSQEVWPSAGCGLSRLSCHTACPIVTSRHARHDVVIHDGCSQMDLRPIMRAGASCRVAPGGVDRRRSHGIATTLHKCHSAATASRTGLQVRRRLLLHRDASRGDTHGAIDVEAMAIRRRRPGNREDTHKTDAVPGRTRWATCPRNVADTLARNTMWPVDLCIGRHVLTYPGRLGICLPACASQTRRFNHD